MTPSFSETRLPTIVGSNWVVYTQDTSFDLRLVSAIQYQYYPDIRSKDPEDTRIVPGFRQPLHEITCNLLGGGEVVMGYRYFNWSAQTDVSGLNTEIENQKTIVFNKYLDLETHWRSLT